MRSKSLRLLFWVPVLLLGTIGCGQAAAPTSPTWATVNGTAITQAQAMKRVHLIEYLNPQAAAQVALHATKVQIVDELVNESLLLVAAKKANVTASAAQVQQGVAGLEQTASTLYPTASQRASKMKALDLTTADLSAYASLSVVLTTYLQKEVKTPTISQAQIAAYYNANKASFVTPTQYDVRHILVKTQALATQILAQLKAGADFATLAKKYSIDTGSAANGGDLGYAALSLYVTPFADAVKLLKVGELSPVVHTIYGYHVLQLVGTKPGGQQTLQQVAAQITTLLVQQAQQAQVQTLINQLRAKAKIKETVPPKA